MKYTHLITLLAANIVLNGCAPTTPYTISKPPASDTVLDARCLTETGSRISTDRTNCRVYGRSYSNNDIARTGATSSDDALRLLDPSITIHR